MLIEKLKELFKNEGYDAYRYGNLDEFLRRYNYRIKKRIQFNDGGIPSNTIVRYLWQKSNHSIIVEQGTEYKETLNNNVVEYEPIHYVTIIETKDKVEDLEFIGELNLKPVLYVQELRSRTE